MIGSLATTICKNCNGTRLALYFSEQSMAHEIRECHICRTPAIPHVPAAFINAISEEGTKAEAIEYLQKYWNENCALRAELRALEVMSNEREELAAMLLARDEAEYDKPIPERLIQWGRVCIAAGKDAKHSGDCTNESHTCGRCLADWTLKQAEQILAMLNGLKS